MDVQLPLSSRRLPDASKLEDTPDLGFALGTGYTERQKKSMIYRHLSKLLVALRKITGGDAVKGRQLSELLHIRTHAKGDSPPSPFPTFLPCGVWLIHDLLSGCSQVKISRRHAKNRLS